MWFLDRSLHRARLMVSLHSALKAPLWVSCGAGLHVDTSIAGMLVYLVKEAQGKRYLNHRNMSLLAIIKVRP
jgi:hypothetical protein